MRTALLTRPVRRRPVEEYEAAVVADAEAFETFPMSKLISLPAVARAVSHHLAT